MFTRSPTRKLRATSCDCAGRPADFRNAALDALRDLWSEEVRLDLVGRAQFWDGDRLATIRDFRYGTVAMETLAFRSA